MNANCDRLICGHVAITILPAGRRDCQVHIHKQNGGATPKCVNYVFRVKLRTTESSPAETLSADFQILKSLSLSSFYHDIQLSYEYE